jgi:transaldolase
MTRREVLELWLDTANLDHIKQGVAWGVISGVTTNPSLVAREGFESTFKDVVKTICGLVKGPVSAEVVSLDVEGMVTEAKELAALAPNVVVKIPITPEGLSTIHKLALKGVKTNCTLIFSPNQALLAALAGATYVSPFIGRIDDVGNDGMEVLWNITQIFHLHDVKTQVIAASIRHPMHVIDAANSGADIITLPFGVIERMIKHPLTDLGVTRFLDDWNAAEIRFG